MKNKKVTFLAIIALICIILAITIDWLFLVPAVIIMIINQKELMKNKKKQKINHKNKE
ncbi:hypothetical protein KAI04_01950 [Candidatus Pacearchaeota archaeon]|nr:hypothetical protein [Candidatus Pacearchaeota archaeon]